MKRGLVLGGGGAKGAYEAGVLKALFEQGYTFDGITGASIGAINGAIIAQGDFARCLELWYNTSITTVLDIDEEKFEKLYSKDFFDKDTLLYFNKVIVSTIKNKGFSMEKAELLVNTYIDEDKLRASPVDYGFVTFSLTDFKPVELFKEEVPEGMLKKFILASAYFPAFRRSPIDGKNYFDGGIYDNLPINPLIKKGGYGEIIAISTGSKMPRQKQMDTDIPIAYIEPSVPLGRTLDFRTQTVRSYLEIGYNDGLSFLRNTL